ncbi:inner membrane protein YhjD [Nakamurella alba]|uniref:inner membrane protein YhjD n=1 Tax=Nakamurella alba TaxID=2665158 RepID=UPI0018AB182C|nr:inner membrane protein YhjD [Nakamurella alba]
MASRTDSAQGGAKGITSRPGIAHLIRAAQRFSARLGTQFAAAITYFSFLSLVPILMVAFSVAGFVLAGRPELLNDIRDKITEQIPGGLSDSISGALDTAIDSRLSVGLIGLVVALYSGIGWMGNIRAAVQAQWRSDFDEHQEIAEENFIVGIGRNLVRLVGLGLAIVVSLGLSTAGAALSPQIVRWLGLENQGWLHPILVIVPILLAVAADTLIFIWVYTSLSPRDAHPARKPLLRGALAAAIGFEVLKQALTLLPQLFNRSASYQIFGNIIGLLFFFNLTATLVLFVAAWISTADGTVKEKPWVEQDDEIEEGDLPLTPEVVAQEPISGRKAAGLLGAGALLGFGAGRRRR